MLVCVRARVYVCVHAYVCACRQAFHYMYRHTNAGVQWQHRRGGGVWGG